MNIELPLVRYGEAERTPIINLYVISLLTLAIVVLMTCGAMSGVVTQSQRDQFLKAHNMERQRLGFPLLVWDYTLAAYANEYVAS